MIYRSLNSDIVITDDVVDLWNGFRQLKSGDKEACGVLIGQGDHEAGRYKIILTTVPMLKDHRTRYGFKLLDVGHQSVVDENWEKSGGSQFYMGYWHSHPQKKPNPSSLDLRQWRSNYVLNKNHLPHLFYPIVGLDRIDIWDVDSKRITKMDLLANENS